MLFVDISNDTARVADCDRVGGNVAGDNTAGSYYAIVADSHSGHHGYLCAEPHIAAHGDGSCIFEPFVTLYSLDGMTGV